MEASGSGRTRALVIALAAVVAALGAASGAGAEHVEDRPGFLPNANGLTPWRGDLHAHTAYSDGHDTPAVAFAQAKAAGWLDFFAVTDHSELLEFPWRGDPECLGTRAMECYASPLPARTEWEDTAEAADAATEPRRFHALRGFEWSSPLEGHVNVFFTRGYVNALTTGPAPMTGLYAWMDANPLEVRSVVGVFNHPGRGVLSFDGYAYVDWADDEMQAVEAFNRGNDHSDEYRMILDRGWHVGAIGVTDGHDVHARTNADHGHTVVLSGRTPDLMSALHHRHTVATLGSDQDARFFVAGTLMGGVDAVPAGVDAPLVEVRLLDASGDPFTRVELVGPRGFVHVLDVPVAPEVRHGENVPLRPIPTTDLGERYLFARAYQVVDGVERPTVVTSPVWFGP